MASAQAEDGEASDIRSDLPLEGLRIIELGHYIAAPFATRVLADLGAEIIKIEPPESGDPVRQWGMQADGQSIWWSVHSRNKKCITLNLKRPEAVEILADLVASSDALIENFRPGQLERLGLSDAFFQSHNPRLAICHISGYGQTGPMRERACFGVIGEAVGGLRYLTNHPEGMTDLPPVRVGVSIGDSVAGLYAAIGILATLAGKNSGSGRIADVALTEAVLSLLEGTLPEYGLTGEIRRPMGGRIPTAAPSNAFPTADGGWCIVAANSDGLFRELAVLMERPDLIEDARFATNQARCTNVDTLETLISEWTRGFDGERLESLCEAADIPACRVYRVSDIVDDEQYRARKMVQTVEDPRLGEVLHPGAVPCFGSRDRDVRWTGPEVGHHNEEVYRSLLNIEADRYRALREDGVI